MTITGKFVTIPIDEESYQDGQVTDEIADGFLVVRLCNVIEGAPHSRIFSIADLVDGYVFDTEIECDLFKEWITQEPVKILKFEKH